MSGGKIFRKRARRRHRLGKLTPGQLATREKRHEGLVMAGIEHWKRLLAAYVTRPV